MYKNIVKPLLDFLVALMALVFLLPVIVCVMILLGLANKGNPFFVQQRPGKNGKLFRIIKFKTMSDKRDIHGRLLSDEQRLTVLGALVRKSSLDEIPQLLNVILGHMSLVGPRPLLPQYLKLYNEHQDKRHLVKPGITGWAQVNGRNAISWGQKFDLDVWYVNNLSLTVDLKILWKTFFKVASRQGVSQKNMATTEPFNGLN